MFAALLIAALANPQATPGPQVRAVLFHSPQCSHCREVIGTVLPPIMDRFGDDLVIMGINTLEPAGAQAYREAVVQLAIPPERQGVPTLIVGSRILVGTVEIRDGLPAAVEAGRETGVDWPDLAAVRLAAAARERSPTTTATASEVVPGGGPWIGFRTDPVGSTIAVVLLGLMSLALVRAVRPPRPGDVVAGAWPGWLTPGLSAGGLAVAGYLTFVEARALPAVCGPIGDCNAVQQSVYSQFLGTPVAVWGLLGYGLILAAWLLGRSGPPGLRQTGGRAVFTLAMVGTVGSMVLTFLEPFVIGAVCAWCLTSAALLTALLWIHSPPAPVGVGTRRAG